MASVHTSINWIVRMSQPKLSPGEVGHRLRGRQACEDPGSRAGGVLECVTRGGFHDTARGRPTHNCTKGLDQRVTSGLRRSQNFLFVDVWRRSRILHDARLASRVWGVDRGGGCMFVAYVWRGGGGPMTCNSQ